MISTRRHRLHPRGARRTTRAGVFDLACPATLRHSATSSAVRVPDPAADRPRVLSARVHIETVRHLSPLRPERTPDPRG